MVSGPWRSTFTTCRLVAWSLAWLLECDQERVIKERARAVTWLKKGMGGLEAGRGWFSQCYSLFSFICFVLFFLPPSPGQGW